MKIREAFKDIDVLLTESTAGKNLQLSMEDSLGIDYPGNCTEFLAPHLFLGIGNLIDETLQYRGNDILIRGFRDSSREVLEVLSSGEALKVKTIENLNRNYYEGRGLSKRPRFQGSRITGYHFGKIGASVSIDNIREGIYLVSNRVEFALSQK